MPISLTPSGEITTGGAPIPQRITLTPSGGITMGGAPIPQRITLTPSGNVVINPNVHFAGYGGGGGGGGGGSTTPSPTTTPEPTPPTIDIYEQRRQAQAERDRQVQELQRAGVPAVDILEGKKPINIYQTATGQVIKTDPFTGMPLGMIGGDAKSGYIIAAGQPQFPQIQTTVDLSELKTRQQYLTKEGKAWPSDPVTGAPVGAIGFNETTGNFIIAPPKPQPQFGEYKNEYLPYNLLGFIYVPKDRPTVLQSIFGEEYNPLSAKFREQKPEESILGRTYRAGKETFEGIPKEAFLFTPMQMVVGAVTTMGASEALFGTSGRVVGSVGEYGVGELNIKLAPLDLAVSERGKKEVGALAEIGGNIFGGSFLLESAFAKMAPKAVQLGKVALGEVSLGIGSVEKFEIIKPLKGITRGGVASRITSEGLLVSDARTGGRIVSPIDIKVSAYTERTLPAAIKGEPAIFVKPLHTVEPVGGGIFKVTPPDLMLPSTRVDTGLVTASDFRTIGSAKITTYELTPFGKFEKLIGLGEKEQGAINYNVMVMKPVVKKVDFVSDLRLDPYAAYEFPGGVVRRFSGSRVGFSWDKGFKPKTFSSGSFKAVSIEPANMKIGLGGKQFKLEAVIRTEAGEKVLSKKGFTNFFIGETRLVVPEVLDKITSKGPMLFLNKGKAVAKFKIEKSGLAKSLFQVPEVKPVVVKVSTNGKAVAKFKIEKSGLAKSLFQVPEVKQAVVKVATEKLGKEVSYHGGVSQILRSAPLVRGVSLGKQRQVFAEDYESQRIFYGDKGVTMDKLGKGIFTPSGYRQRGFMGTTTFEGLKVSSLPKVGQNIFVKGVEGEKTILKTTPTEATILKTTPLESTILKTTPIEATILKTTPIEVFMQKLPPIEVTSGKTPPPPPPILVFPPIPPINFGMGNIDGGAKGGKLFFGVSKARKTKTYFKFGSDLFRKFSTGEKDLPATRKNIAMFKRMKGTIGALGAIPTAEQLLRFGKKKR